MTESEKTYRTKTGCILTDADIERLADEIARTEYVVESPLDASGHVVRAMGTWHE